jgi:hypothetical protein
MLHAIRKYGENLNTHDILKFLAIVLMVIDHVGYYFFREDHWFRVVGRMCIPIWFFFIGYSKSQKIDWPIIAGTVLLTGFNALIYAPILPLRILATIIACRLLHRYFLNNYLAKKDFDIFDAILLCFMIFMFYLPTLPLVDYGSIILVFSCFGRMVRTGVNNKAMAMFMVLGITLFCSIEAAMFSFSIPQTIVLFIGISLVTFILGRYELKEFTINWKNPLGFITMLLGRNTLAFYVAHLIVFLIIDQYIHPERYTAFKWFN